MSNDEPDPIKSAAEGATKATLEFSAEAIKGWVSRLNHRELAFIQNIEEIKFVAEIRKLPEWDIYDKYIKNPKLRVIVQMGIALRRVEHDRMRLENLRGDIVNGHGVRGLRQAEFVQNKILGKYVTEMVEEGMVKADIVSLLEELLEHVDKYCLFINATTKPTLAKKTLETRSIQALPVVIVFASGQVIDKANAIIVKTNYEVMGYRLNTHLEDTPKKQTAFFIHPVEGYTAPALIDTLNPTTSRSFS